MSDPRLLIILLYVFIFFLPLKTPAFAQTPEDPAATTSENETTASGSGPINYTDEEFINLSDDAKRNVYLDSPELLPDNFDPEPYMDIFHPQQ